MAGQRSKAESIFTIERVAMGRRRDTIHLRCAATAAEPGREGNLIVNAYAARAGEGGNSGKEQRKPRRILLGSLPAIPFRIVAP